MLKKIDFATTYFVATRITFGMTLSDLKDKFLSSKFFKDSFWAVFGNGMGNFLLLIAGIVIARILGKDLYGEYGMIKTTMFHIASFSTLGLGFTSTKYISAAVLNHSFHIRSLIKTSVSSTLLFSSFLCLFLIIFADSLALFIDEPTTASSFRTLGIIVVFRAINTVCAGVLAGFKEFKKVGINSIISGFALLVLSSILTYTMGVIGSFIALSISQFINASLNFFCVSKAYKINECEESRFDKDILIFTLPVAIQEFSYMLCTWGGTMLLSKYASLGEVGLWSAASQWNTVILFIPTLLSNVVLSYLSGDSQNTSRRRMLISMLKINFFCSIVPFVLVFLLAGVISSFYGQSFIELKYILRILTMSTIFMCLSNVFQSNMIAEGRNWLLLIVRLGRDVVMLSSFFFVLMRFPERVSYAYSWVYVLVYIVYCALLCLLYFFRYKEINGGFPPQENNK